MHKPIIASVAALALAACVTTGAPPVVAPPVPIVSDDPVVSGVQEYTREICSFVASSTDIIELAGTFTGYGDIATLVTSLGQTICAVIQGARVQSRRGVTRTFIINGVRVDGRFVARRR